MSARAFIAFLRCEASQAEGRARALRTVAANIENHASADADSARKATKRKVGRPKRQHTAYTMFVMENYEAIRKSNADMPSKEIISMVARQWAQVSDEEKELWKERAVSHQATVVATEVAEELIGAEYYDDVHDENKADDGTKKKRAAGPMKKAKHAIPPEL